MLEGVALSLLDCKNYLDGLSIPHKGSATLIGGGAKGKLWRKITSDALGITLQTVENSDSSLGSAMLAGIASGVFADPADALRRCLRVTGEVVPDPSATERYAAVFERYKRVHDALAPLYGDRL